MMEHGAVTPLQILREDGTIAPGARVPDVGRETLRRMFRTMVLGRTLDDRLITLQRQGRVGFYGEARGQEAAIVGSAAALDDGDWVLPALRESGVALYRGYALHHYVAQVMGNAHDLLKGRQLSCHYGDRRMHYVPMSSCVGTQIPHAVGAAMAARIQGHKTVVIGYMGDGATSTHDFHVAMNFAGVFKAPVILFCNNNQFSISVPVSGQTAAATLADKGDAYGIEAARVDGNDVLACFAATKQAADKARSGGGPTFIEALTYRVGAHSSSDDPSRYRDESVTVEWREKKDPIARFSKWLRAEGILSEADEAKLREELDTAVREAIAAEEAVGPPPLETLISDVYAQPPWHLREQFDALVRHRASKEKR
jgi:pyruvate dehydrogenase E1 component alpha subunit/2-oxoisovalerate dehydrogenase E1 component alpha subunit